MYLKVKHYNPKNPKEIIYLTARDISNEISDEEKKFLASCWTTKNLIFLEYLNHGKYFNTLGNRSSMPKEIRPWQDDDDYFYIDEVDLEDFSNKGYKK